MIFLRVSGDTLVRRAHAEFHCDDGIGDHNNSNVHKREYGMSNQANSPRSQFWAQALVSIVIATIPATIAGVLAYNADRVFNENVLKKVEAFSDKVDRLEEIYPTGDTADTIFRPREPKTPNKVYKAKHDGFLTVHADYSDFQQDLRIRVYVGPDQENVTEVWGAIYGTIHSTTVAIPMGHHYRVETVKGKRDERVRRDKVKVYWMPIEHLNRNMAVAETE